jgi:hypothetical protein
MPNEAEKEEQQRLIAEIKDRDEKVQKDAQAANSDAATWHPES